MHSLIYFNQQKILPDMNLRDKCKIQTLKGMLLSLLSESSLCLFGIQPLHLTFNIILDSNDNFPKITMFC